MNAIYIYMGALGIALAAGCGAPAEAPDAEAASAEGSAYSRVINVEIAPVDAGPFTEVIRLTGTVRANQDVRLAAEESGRIQEILVEKGNRVEEGQPILRIDGSILAAQVEQARARAVLAEEVWQRRRRLYEEQQVGTGLAYLEARATAEEMAANLDALEERLDRTTIRAPFGGILEDRLVELGEMVSPGTLVGRIVQLETVKVTAGVPERYAPDVETGSAVTVSFDVFPDEVLEGEITYVGSTVDPQSRTFPVEFSLENPRRVIKPEMVANIRIVRRSLDEAVVVSQEALVRTAEGFRAFVARGEGESTVAEARDVELGPTRENRVVVESGLQPGDRLIVVGQQQVAHGDRIRIVSSSGGATP